MNQRSFDIMAKSQPDLNGALFLKKWVENALVFSEKSGSGRRIKLPK
jgi:hypothetical protein